MLFILAPLTFKTSLDPLCYVGIITANAQCHCS